MTKRVAIGLKLPPGLLEEVDELRQAYPMGRTAIIERALREWIDRNRGRLLGTPARAGELKDKPPAKPRAPAKPQTIKSRAVKLRAASPADLVVDLTYERIED